MSAAWFAAAAARDRDALAALLDGGADVDCRDDRGRTALFHVIAPSGGDPALFVWLLEHGADPNVRDDGGETAIEHGARSTSSPLEDNLIIAAEVIAYLHGYRPGGFSPAVEDYWGEWLIVAGSGGGERRRDARLILSPEGIESTERWLRLDAEERRLDADGVLRLHGDHIDEEIHVRVELIKRDRAVLRWTDSIAGPVELVLARRQ